LTNVALHLKGAAGSFRGVDDKPAFTVNFGRFADGQRFHGLQKIHLNNSVQDPSYLNEFLAGELFRAAGVPAPRVTWAFVELNGRKLGLYVVKEGFTKDFLSLYFQKNNGNLYDMEPGREVTERLQKDTGSGPDDWSDLRRLADACREPDVTKLWPRLQQTLDTERFISFMAMEVITCHWDGYALARNNFRVYHDNDTGKILFFPHGTDQLFGNAGAPWKPGFAGLVAQAVMKTPEGARRYRERFQFLLTNVFQADALTNRVMEVAAALRPAIAAGNTNLAREFAGQAAAVCDRLVQRALNLERQLNAPPARPLQFENGLARLAGWRPQTGQGNARLEELKLDGLPVLHIRCDGGACVASWRATVLLEPGRYRFTGRARCAGLDPQTGESGSGGGLRISGGKRTNKLAGDADWTRLDFEFSPPDGSSEVELVCELRANKGAIWFDAPSLRLERLK
jgi:hypothetical protein